MMANTKHSVDFLIKNAAKWSIFDEGHLVAHVITDTKHRCIVTDEEINRVYPYLALAIRAASAWKRRNTGYPDVSRDNVLETLQIHQGHYPALKTVAGHPVFFSRFINIDAIYEENVSVFGAWFITEAILVDGVEVRFSINMTQNAVPILRTSLDKHFEGWDKRYKAGCDLGVDRDELMRLVFARNPVTAAIPSEVSFDL